jgi:transposase, IS30 family
MVLAGRPRVPRARVRMFWRAHKAGAPHGEAVAAAGVSGTAGRKWIAQAGGVVPDLAEPSGRYLSQAEREEIAVGIAAGLSKAEIGRRLGWHRSTIGREINRNQLVVPERLPPAPDGRAHRPGPKPGQHRGQRRSPDERARRYRAGTAQAKAEERARRPKPGKLAVNAGLREQVRAGLQARWSPEQIARTLRRDHPDQPEMWVSHETIYRALYVQGRGELRRELSACLRTGRALRRPRTPAPGRRHLPDKIMISARPAEAADRAVPGHWEGDLILGKNGRSAIGTLVERSTRFVMLLHLPHTAAAGNRAEQVRDALIATVATLPAALRRSLTWDQGAEMSRHAEISLATDLPIYFCDPHSPWQRGSNENTNGLLRQYFPKGTDLSVHTPDHLAAVAEQLNSRPRKTLGWHTPAQTLARLLSNPSTTGVATTP